MASIRELFKNTAAPLLAGDKVRQEITSFEQNWTCSRVLFALPTPCPPVSLLGLSYQLTSTNLLSQLGEPPLLALTPSARLNLGHGFLERYSWMFGLYRDSVRMRNSKDHQIKHSARAELHSSLYGFVRVGEG